jgi:hypothetical protein
VADVGTRGNKVHAGTGEQEKDSGKYSSAGAGNRQGRKSEIADAGTGGKQVQEQAECQEQEVSRYRNRRNRKMIKRSMRVLDQEIGKTRKAR